MSGEKDRSDKIHYGSLENEAKKRFDSDKQIVSNGNSAVSKGKLSFDCPSYSYLTIHGVEEAKTLPFSSSVSEAQEKHQKLMNEWENKKKARQSAIPTDDKLVQARLRELGEPIILFGELAPERRERLRDFMAKKGIEDGWPSVTSVSATELIRIERQDEVFYTEGSPALKAARLWITKYSLSRAKQRLDRERKKRDEEDRGDRMDVDRTFNFDGFVNTSSQVGDERPLSYCCFSHDGQQLATASWTGLCKIWNVSDCSLLHTFRGHTDRATSVVWHPEAAKQSPGTCSLASSGADKMVILWSKDSDIPLQELKGHQHRVNRVAFHPSGRFIGSTGGDLTWRLWDVETGKELLEQEGHSRSLYAISFQCDGSLVVTGGADYIGRIWDLRSGKSIQVLRGHSKQITAFDFAPNGYQLASGGEDNTVRIWDLRKKRAIYTIPAHESLVSHVRYHADGELILTSSFDNSCKLWSGTQWTHIKTIKGTEGKVMCADLTPDLKILATANYDRTWKVFAKDESSI